ncbi:hypothetical protein K0I73_03300 [Shewanella mesophila]|uniref:hypothetical protein n=1 Tax=Shewanella mesophila TaxID=2864208 RepID=UPI001C6579D1|nr:hypothetical protein [Shewanella mesophila]QYJ86788.1 hypothetical protein K0I73_03300 [Shewanella mesophila]
MKVIRHEFNEAINNATSIDLSELQLKELKSYLLSCKAVLKASHPYHPQINSALTLLEHNYGNIFKWYQKPLGLVLIAGLGGVVTYGLLILLGWVNLPQG